MATTKQWLDWLKCNILELIILVLIVVLLVKVYSVPAVENVPAVTEVAVEESLAEEAAPAVPVEGAITEEVPVEGAPTKAEEQPLETGAIPEPTAEIPKE